MVAATAGTTNAGMIDPLIGLWRDRPDRPASGTTWTRLGEARSSRPTVCAVRSPALSWPNSLTIDAHKWFATTMGCGMFITRHPQVLSSAFQVSASYMPSNVPDLDPYVTSVAMVAAVSWAALVLVARGGRMDGLWQHVERSIELIGLLKEKFVAQGWKIANDRFACSVVHRAAARVRRRRDRSSAEFSPPAVPGSRWRHSRDARSSGHVLRTARRRQTTSRSSSML